MVGSENEFAKSQKKKSHFEIIFDCMVELHVENVGFFPPQSEKDK